MRHLDPAQIRYALIELLLPHHDARLNVGMRFWPHARLDPTQVIDQRAAYYRDQLRGYNAPGAYNRSHSGSAKILDPGDFGNYGPNAGAGGDYGPYQRQENPFGIRRRRRRR